MQRLYYYCNGLTDTTARCLLAHCLLNNSRAPAIAVADGFAPPIMAAISRMRSSSLSMRMLLDVFSDALSLYTDRKSTRLNSSHVKISYAVFCLKKNTSQHARCPPDARQRPR